MRRKSRVSAIETRRFAGNNPYPVHQVRAPDTDRVFVTRFKCVLLDLEQRRAVEVPDDIRQKAQAFVLPES